MPAAKQAEKRSENGAEAPAIDLGLEAPQDVEVHLDNAYRIREGYKQVVAARKSNREALRNLADQGVLSAEQLAEFHDLYPPRTAAEAEPEKVAA